MAWESGAARRRAVRVPLRPVLVTTVWHRRLLGRLPPGTGMLSWYSSMTNRTMTCRSVIGSGPP